MKGIVFKEFSEMVEASFGEAMLDTVIENSDLPSGGVYTSVGTYPHTELVSMVVTLSEETEIPVQDLVKAFGKYLFGRFLDLFPIFFTHKTSFEFLASIHDVVHVEVLKLYPDAELPDFIGKLSEDGRTLHFEYHSHRHFADLAIGLMEGTFDHWNENVEIEMEDRSTADKQIVMFICRRID
ncbi:MAG: heme NO-binding domain-containing protein [Candidatus Poseidoniaceae archaeon]